MDHDHALNEADTTPGEDEQAEKADTRTGSKRSLYVGVFGLMLGMFLAMLDGLIIGTALPTITGELGGLDLLPWVITAYLLAAAATTPIWGKLGDLYDRKAAFMAAVLIFLIGSTLAGLSQDMTQLITFRAVQGLGAGGLMAGAMSIIGVLVPPRESGRLQSMVGAMMPVAFIGGPLLGGYLTDELSWRWTFYVNVPVGIVALLIVGAFIKLHSERITARIDYLGAALLTTAVVALTLLAGWAGTTYAWGSAPVLAPAVVGALALYCFVRTERRAVEPIIPPRLFRSRNFTLAQILSFLVGAVMLTLSNYLPQYMQFVHGASSTASGMLLLPLMFGMLAAQLTTGHLISRNGRYRVYPILGGALTCAGSVVLLLLGPGTSTALASGLTLVAGLGMGLLMQSTVLITVNSTDARDMGAASGTVALLRTIGGSLGIALFGALYTSRLEGTLADGLGARAAQRLSGQDGQLAPAQVRALPEPVRDAFATAVTSGLHGILVGLFALALITVVTAWAVREVPLRTEAPGASEPGGAG